MITRSSLLFFLLTVTLHTNAQNTFHLRLGDHEKIPAGQSQKVLAEKMNLGDNDQLQLLRTHQDELGTTHNRYQRYYKGIKVEHGIAITHAHSGYLTSMNGENASLSYINTAASLSDAQALQKALAFIKAKKYKWEDPLEEKALQNFKNDIHATYYPKGELVICQVTEQNHSQNGNYTLAYKFDVYAAEPLSREYIYVDANDGSIVSRDAIIKHTDVTGIASTRYSGSRGINTEFINSSYRLHDNSRGGGIITARLDANNNPSDISDNDNNWTTAEFKNASNDDAALDAHWGAMMTFDYWKKVHGRSGYDDNNGALFNYVHYGGPTYANASWDGVDKVMLYGDGNGSPYTSLDICAHEIGHAITQFTSNLVYSNESGALNEGFSDIWAACVEYYTDPTKQTWLIGEEVIGGGGYLRSMNNPNVKNQPDTYKGTYWYTGAQDYGGVHENSGVLNYWFYLLAHGGTGSNDLNFSFNVTSIGIDKAAKIAYRTEKVYLTPNAQFIDAMYASILAATDLFGANSNEVIQVANAWMAVGVYDPQLPAPSNLQATLPAAKQVDLSWTDNSSDETGFVIERNSGSAFSVIATVGPDVTTYSDLTINGITSYNYRVKALKNYTVSTYSNTITAGTMLPPILNDLSNESTTGFTFNWFPVQSSTFYQLDVATDAAFTSFLLGYQNLNINAPIVTIDNLTPSTTYYCRVRASNGIFTSSNSQVLTISTLSDIPTTTMAQLIGAGSNSIYKMNRDGSGLHVIKNTGTTNSFVQNIVQGPSDYIYGSTVYGSDAPNSGGRIFRMRSDGSQYTVLHDFNSSDGELVFSLFLGVDGKLYGTTEIGGAYNDGTIFKMNIDGANFVKLYDFSDRLHTLLQAPDGTLFGTVRFGPNTGDWGYVFKLQPDGSGFTILHTFDQHYEGYPKALVLGTDGNLYGLTENYNVINQKINLYKISTNGIYNLLTIGASGIGYVSGGSNGFTILQNPSSKLIAGELSPFPSSFTYLYAIDPDGSNLQVIHKFQNSSGTNGSVFPSFIAPNGLIYGAYASGTSNFIYKVATDGSNFSILANGAPATGGLIHAYTAQLLYIKLNQTIVGNTIINKTYGDADFDGPFTASSGLSLTYSSPIDTNVVALKNGKISITGVGTTTVQVTQAGNDDYNSVTATVTINVSPVPLIDQAISFSPFANTYTYGDVNIILSATGGASGNPVTYSSSDQAIAQIVNGNEVMIVGAGNVDITASQFGNANYSAAADIKQTLVILKKDLTVTAKDTTKVYGSFNPDFAIIYSGFVNQEDENILTNKPSTICTADITTPAGSVIPILVSNGTSGNYNFIYVNGTLTISRATPFVQWSQPADLAYGNPLGSLQLNATANTPGTFTYSPSTGTILNAGSNQPLSVNFIPDDNINYQTSQGINTFINITQALQSIVFDDYLSNKKAGDQFTLLATSTSGLIVSYSISDSSIATINENIVTVLDSGKAIITASQNGNENYLPAPDVQKELNIIADDTSADDTFYIYPNPSSEAFRLTGKIAEITSLELFTIIGQKTFADIVKENGSEITINLKDKDAGVYILKITLRSGVTTHLRMVKK